MLASAEAQLRYQLGETDRVRQLGVLIATATPRLSDGWSWIAGASYKEKGFEQAARAMAAWVPSNPDGWNMLGFGEPQATDEERLRLMRRAVELAPELPLWSLNYATLLLNAGQRERARAPGRPLSSWAQRVHSSGWRSRRWLSSGG